MKARQQGTDSVDCHLVRLRKDLRDAIERARLRDPQLTDSYLAREIGHSSSYPRKMLDGRVSLKVREVIALLEVLGLPPLRFFDRSFPLAGEVEVEARQYLVPPLPRHDSQMPALDFLVRPPFPVPEVVERRAAELLKTRVRDAGWSLRQASRDIGLSSPDALPLALRGATRLTFRHVFQVLSLIGLSPGRFFAGLLGPDNTKLVPEMNWNELLDHLEPFLYDLARGVVEEGEGLRRWEEEGEEPG